MGDLLANFFLDAAKLAFHMTPEESKLLVARLVSLAGFTSLNIGLNFFNKRVFSERVGFTFPLFLTTFHMVRHQHADSRSARPPRW